MHGIVGVLLAAGRGVRMGRPKALLRWGAETFVSRLARTWAVVCDPVIVVGGARFDEVKAQMEPPAIAVFNPAFDGPMLTSVQRGLGAVPASAAAVLLGPVDQPLLDAGLLQDIVAAWRDDPERVVVPEHDARAGHPILLPRRFLAELAREPEWSSLEAFLARNADAVRRLDLPQRPEILVNVNSPDDYRAFMAAALEDEQTRL